MHNDEEQLLVGWLAVRANLAHRHLRRQQFVQTEIRAVIFTGSLPKVLQSRVSLKNNIKQIDQRAKTCTPASSLPLCAALPAFAQQLCPFRMTNSQRDSSCFADCFRVRIIANSCVSGVFNFFFFFFFFCLSRRPHLQPSSGLLRKQK